MARKQVSTATESVAVEIIKARKPRAPRMSKALAAIADAAIAQEIEESKAEQVTQEQAPAVEPEPVNANPFGPAPTQEGLKLTHAIKDGFRPSSGAALFAHTSVFLTHSGIDAKPMPSALVDTFIGARAIAYHMSKGNFTKVADKRAADGTLVQRGGLMLSPQGVELFAKRKPDPELYSAFENVLCRGEVDDRAVKNAAGIVQVAAK